ncbi:MAG: thermonuclease family protein [Candidatus Pacearchaeota archaeon]
MRKNFLLILIIIIALILVYFLFFHNKENKENFHAYSIKEIKNEKVKNTEILFVTKIIDGDTIIANGKVIRLNGIDADEKNEKCYYAAKYRLEEILLNKEVIGEYFDKDVDAYNRSLRYIILNGENINLKMIQEGYAIARVSDDEYSEIFIKSEELSRKNKIGCKWNDYHVCNAINFVGKEVTLYGRIFEVYITKNKTYLNFEGKYPYNCFVAILNFSNQNLKIYEKKEVKVKGKVEIYKNKPGIFLKSLEEIEILE